VLDGGPGDNVVLDSFAANSVKSASAAGSKWVKAHVRTVNGKAALLLDGKQIKLPRISPAQLQRAVGSV
jgi:hypothetical protein